MVRNSDGLVMASLAQQIPLPPSVIEVETLAARRALEFALELGFERIILEGDSESLDKALKMECRNFTTYGHLVQDILFLSTHLSEFKTSLVRRQGNNLAHSLARKSQFLSHMSVWMEDVPSDLLSVLEADFTSLQ